MKKGKPDKKVEVKNFTQPKDIIPDKLVSTLKVREPRLAKTVEPTNSETLEKNKFVQDPLFEEWPADEVVGAFDFGVTVEKVFKDPVPLKFPPSFIKSADGPLVTMKRYKEYLAAFMEKNSVAVSRKTLLKQNSMVGEPVQGTRNRRTGSFHQNPEKMDLSDFQRVDHSDKVDIKVCDFFDRPETPEEAEERKRKEEALNKGKKKPAGGDKKKPGQAVEEEPVVMVKEPQLGFISMVGHKPLFSTWIGSILQVIKDRDIRDCYTQKSILKNIYPQVDGVPVYNPSGRYWVKLYFLGKARKVEIDDVFPFDGYTFRFLFPMAEYGNILWPMILTKAIYKLLGFKWKYNDPNHEIGEGAVLHALTGLLPCTFNLKSLSGEWNLLEEALSNSNYFGHRAYVVGYNSIPYTNPHVPSNEIDRKSAFIAMSRQYIHPATPLHLSRAQLNQHDDQANPSGEYMMDVVDTTSRVMSPTSQAVGFRSSQDHYLESNLMPGFAYSIFDCFTNAKFNMVYVQKIPDWEIQMRRKYLEALKETTNRKTKEYILEIKRKRKELRARIKEEDKKRLDLMARESVNFRLFKIMSNIIDHKPLTVVCPFNEEEIYTAKKCVGNKLSRPPNYYDFYEDKRDDKSNMSVPQQAGPAGAGSSNQQTAIENSITAALRSLADFSKLNSCKEPPERGRGGAWILDNDLASCFDFVQIYFNPKVYHNLKSEYFPCEREKLNNFRPEAEVIVLEEIKEGDHSEGASNPHAVQALGTTDPKSIAASPSGNLARVSPESLSVMQNSYTRTALADDEEGSSHDKPKVLEFLFSFNTSPFNQLEQLKPYCILEKFDFDNLTAVSSHPTLSGVVDALKITKPNENTVLRVVTYSPTSFSITLASNAKFRIMSIPQYLMDYERWTEYPYTIEYKPVEKGKYAVLAKIRLEGSSSAQDVMIRYNFENDRYVKNHTRCRVIRLPDHPGKMPNPTIEEGIHSGVESDQLVLAGREYHRFYHKAGERYLIMLDVLPNYNVGEGTLKLQVISKQDAKVTNLDVTDTQEFADKYVPYKYGVIFRERLFVHNPEVLTAFRLFMFKVPNSGTDDQGAKQPVAGNPKDAGKKAPPGKQAPAAAALTGPVIDMDQAKELEGKKLLYLELYEENTLKKVVSGYNEVTLYNSVLQGDKNAPTNLFELRKKKMQGLPLTEEEVKVLTEPKEQKYAPEDPNKKAGGPGKPGAKPAAPAPQAPKKPAAGAAAGKKDPKDVEKEEVKKEIVFPKSTEHIMTEVKDFLRHMERQRTTVQELDENSRPRVREQREFDEINEKCLMAKEDTLSLVDKLNRRREELKKLREKENEERLKVMAEQVEVMKKKYEDAKESLNLWNQDRQKKKDNESNLLTILSAETLQEASLRDAIKKGREQGVDERLIFAAEKYLKNTVIKNAGQTLKEKLEAFDEAGVKAAKEFIEQHNIQVEEELMLQCEDFFSNIEANPNYIQEKLAELKKQPKPKKK